MRFLRAFFVDEDQVYYHNIYLLLSFVVLLVAPSSFVLTSAWLSLLHRSQIEVLLVF